MTNHLMIAFDDLFQYKDFLQPGKWGYSPFGIELELPGLARLEARSTIFRRASAVIPVCGPSRASIMSGYSPYETGVFNNETWDDRIRPEQIWTYHLRRAGYWMGTVGKLFHGYNPVSSAVYSALYDSPPFVVRWNPSGPRTQWGGLSGGGWDGQEDLYYDSMVVEYTKKFLESRSRDDGPWHWEAGFHHPHNPWYAPNRIYSSLNLDDIIPPVDWPLSPAEAVRVCPFNPSPEKVVQDEDGLGQLFFPDAMQSHPRGGRFNNTYIGHSKEFRETSSSGGMATYVFKNLLDRKVVDYLFVVQGDGDSGYKYRVFSGQDDIRSISKTRYYPVTLDKLFDVIENTEGRVAVSGVACFIKAIRLKQHYHPALKEKIAFLVGIICGGLKSKGYTDFLVQSTGISGPYSSAQYRVKQPDGEANDYFFSAVDDAARTRQVRMRRLGDMWGSGLFKSKACDFCTDVLTELADISLGDAWIPEYNKDGMGNSVIVTRTELAELIVQDGIAKGELQAKEAPMDLVVRSQSGGLNHKQNALRSRLMMAREFTDLPVPFVRTRIEKDSTAAEMLVQIHRERVRSKSIAYWSETKDLVAFNKKMRSSRQRLKDVTAARKENAAEVGAKLVSAINQPNSGRRVSDPKMSSIQSAIRFLQLKLHSQQLDAEVLLAVLAGPQVAQDSHNRMEKLVPRAHGQERNTVAQLT